MGLRGNTKKYAFLLLLLLLLTGCGKQEAVTETTTAPPETTDPKYLVTELQMIVTYENLGDLEKYENLTFLGREKGHIVHSDPGRFCGSQRGDAVAVADDRRRFSRLSDLSDRMKPYTAFGEKRGNRGDIFSDPRLPYL